MTEIKLGRPTKFRDEFIEQAHKLCLLGATDVQLADFFEVDEATINRWKLKHPAFCESLKDAKKVADEQVIKSLFNRATGYEHAETKVFYDKDQLDEDDRVVKVPMVKRYAPDTTACIFWLKNRQPVEWRDKQETAITNPDGSMSGLNLKDLTKGEAQAKIDEIYEAAQKRQRVAEAAKTDNQQPDEVDLLEGLE